MPRSQVFLSVEPAGVGLQFEEREMRHLILAALFVFLLLLLSKVRR